MINHGNGYVGIKRLSEELIQPFVDIIKDTNEFIYMGSFSFWLPTDSVWKELISAKGLKLIIMPIDYFNGDAYRPINDKYKIKTLLDNDICVIVNSHNHSKFIVNDKHAYFGSVNLTEQAMVYNVECIATNSNKTQAREDIINFVHEEIRRYRNLMKNFLTYKVKHLAFVDEFMKVKSSYSNVVINSDSLLNMESVNGAVLSVFDNQASLIYIIDQYHALLELNEFINLSKKVKKSIQLSEKLLAQLRKVLTYLSRGEKIYAKTIKDILKYHNENIKELGKIEIYIKGLTKSFELPEIEDKEGKTEGGYSHKNDKLIEGIAKKFNGEGEK
jgi:phosphatidylserine/phosphatidylglycerophosphate/cardiolipin synthase-like enzyme